MIDCFNNFCNNAALRKKPKQKQEHAVINLREINNGLPYPLSYIWTEIIFWSSLSIILSHQFLQQELGGFLFYKKMKFDESVNISMLYSFWKEGKSLCIFKTEFGICHHVNTGYIVHTCIINTCVKIKWDFVGGWGGSILHWNLICFEINIKKRIELKTIK